MVATPGFASSTPQDVFLDKVFDYRWERATGSVRELPFSFAPAADLDISSIVASNVAMTGRFGGALSRMDGGVNDINVPATLLVQLTQQPFGTQLRLRDEQRKVLGTNPVDLELGVAGTRTFTPRLGSYELLTVMGGLPESSVKATGDLRVALRNTLSVQAPASQTTPRPGLLQRLDNWRDGLQDRLFFFNSDSNERPTLTPGYLDRRTDATDLLRNDWQSNAAPTLGDLGIWLQTASPASIAHSLPGTSAPIRLEFDLSILEPNTTFRVLLGGFTVYRTESFASAVSLRHIDLTLQPVDATEITFLVDSGVAGSSAVVSNISVGDIRLEQGEWATRDHGAATWVYSVTSAQIDTINALTAVPEPASVVMMLSGLALIGAMAGRRATWPPAGWGGLPSSQVRRGRPDRAHDFGGRRRRALFASTNLDGQLCQRGTEQFVPVGMTADTWRLPT